VVLAPAVVTDVGLTPAVVTDFVVALTPVVIIMLVPVVDIPDVVGFELPVPSACKCFRRVAQLTLIDPLPRLLHKDRDMQGSANIAACI
jgi:hypothetical protein